MRLYEEFFGNLQPEGSGRGIPPDEGFQYGAGVRRSEGRRFYVRQQHRAVVSTRYSAAEVVYEVLEI